MKLSDQIIFIPPEDRENAKQCLLILGGKLTKYNPQKLFGFKCFMNGNEYWLNRNTLKSVKIHLIKSGFTTRTFHNTFEAAAGLPLDSTLL